MREPDIRDGKKKTSTDNTIQGKLESLLSKLEKKPVEVHSSGRTDAGVHAYGQVISFVLETEKNNQEIMDYMNEYLPEDMGVISLVQAGERFHARLNATGKVYRDRVLNSSVPHIFDRKYVYILDRKPDINKMKKAAEYMLGKHDFASFCSNSKIKKSTVREVDEISIIRNGDYIKFIFHGNGFLYNMVRILTGTLLEVGYGKRTPESIAELFEVKNRSLAGFTAPAQGLCLEKVDYN